MKTYGGSARWYWFVNDHLGTPQKMVDESGDVVWAAAYAPFGEAWVYHDEITNNLRFPGQYYDVETGLHYNWHRYYDPETGRYLRADPIGLAGGMNLFVYVSNTPINAIDPYGLKGPVPVPVPGASTTSNVAKGVFASRWLTGFGAFLATMAPVPAGEGSDIVPTPNNDANEDCERKRCRPCIPPVGTIATEVHKVPPKKPHFPIEGSHVHWFKMNQSPYPDCKCFWKRNFKKPTLGDTTPSGTVPVTPAAGGGPL